MLGKSKVPFPPDSAHDCTIEAQGKGMWWWGVFGVGGQWGHYGPKLWRNYSAGDSFNSTANSSFLQTDSLFLVLSASNLMQSEQNTCRLFLCFSK